MSTESRGLPNSFWTPAVRAALPWKNRETFRPDQHLCGSSIGSEGTYQIQPGTDGKKPVSTLFLNLHPGLKQVGRTDKVSHISWSPARLSEAGRSYLLSALPPS